jgi:hypothetical protein
MESSSAQFPDPGIDSVSSTADSRIADAAILFKGADRPHYGNAKFIAIIFKPQMIAWRDA